jgi:hypothetical protein
VTSRSRTALLFVAALLASSCRLPRGEATDAERRAEHGRLRREFEGLAAQDPVVTEALAQGGDVLLGARPALVEEVFREVAARYLDKVVLDLPLEKTIHESRELEVGTFLGKVKAGTWTLDVTIHRVQGRLRARPPKVAVAADNRLTLDVPVSLEEAHGTITAHFAWDSSSVASVVCHDFEVTRSLTGEVLSQVYPVSGSLLLIAGPEQVRADPEFPPREFRLQVDLTDKSWAEVRGAVEEQDKVGKCGIAIDPEDLVARIRKRLREGFDVKLPRSLFRPVDFPASVRQEVTVQDRHVDLAVETRGLAVTPVAVWFAANVRTRISAETHQSHPLSPSPSPPASPVPSSSPVAR